MFLYLDEFWTKRIFNSKIQILENTDLVFGKISITQKWYKLFEICVELFHICLYIKSIIIKLFLWIFRDFMGFNRIIKT